MYFTTSLGLEFLSPQGIVGVLVLVIGIVFSGMMLYIGYVSIREMYPNKSQKLKVQNLKKQQEKIARLYPQS